MSYIVWVVLILNQDLIQQFKAVFLKRRLPWGRHLRGGMYKENHMNLVTKD